MAKDVKFTATKKGPSVEWEYEPGKPAKDHKTHVKQGDPPEKIKFKLDDKTSLDLRFDCAHPIQVWEQAGCPPKGIQSDQIEVFSCDTGQVTIRDLNTGAPRTLHYQLNVVDKNGNAHPCDPIIENGGGGPGAE